MFRISLKFMKIIEFNYKWCNKILFSDSVTKEVSTLSGFKTVRKKRIQNRLLAHKLLHSVKKVIYNRI